MKINAKTFNKFKFAFCASGFDGITFNDGYNMPKFGITKEQHDALAALAHAMHGMDARDVTLSEINRFLDGEKVQGDHADNAMVARVATAFAH